MYLITGTDLPKVSRALRRLRARFAEGAVDHLFAESATGLDVVGVLNAMGLLAGEKLVVVEGIERWKGVDLEAVIAYLDSPTPGSTLALVGDPSKLAGLADACAAAGSILRFDVTMRRRGAREVPDYPAWVRNELEGHGHRVGNETAERLVELVGEDSFALRSEVEKLVTWAGEEPIGLQDVEELAVPGAETASFALVDGWGSRNVGAALAACEGMRRKGDETYAIVARLADYVAKVRRVHALVEQDLGPREIAARLGLKDFPARKQAGQAANFSRAELEASVVRLALLDLAVKGGSRLDSDLELERAIVDVTARHDA